MATLTPVGDQERWDRIARWNQGIREEFFSGQWAGRPVYLDLEDDVIGRVARRAGSNEDEPERALAELLRPTLYVDSGSPPLLTQHLSRERRWRAHGAEETPPFLAVLAFFSLVAEGMRSDGEFRASNYYGRLCQAIGVDPSESSVKTKVSHGFMNGSPALWSALNGWLDAHEGRLGLPTAYSFDSRVYVGLPLSQALVRDADRRVFPDMFSAFRLRPGQVVSRSDMARLLGDWAGGSRISLGLKRLLEKGGDILSRIADVACIELQAWDGTIEESEGAPAQEASLLLTAQMRRQPVESLYLDIGIERGLSLPSGPYSLGEGASTHAVAAFEALDGSLTPLEADGHGWRAIADSSLLALPDLLLANVKLTNAGVSLRRAARRLIVLEHDEELRRYTEVSRVQLGSSNLLLCHESLANELAATLEQIACPGSTPRTATELAGVPEGWVAFVSVEIFAISETDNVDLMPLVPISWTQVSFGGGFPLPGRLTWLAEAPPEIRTSSAEGERVTVSLTCERPLSQAEPDTEELATFVGSGVASIHPDADGDYRISLSDADRPKAAVLASALVRLRSADNPRPILSADEPALVHSLNAPLGAISAGESEASRPEVDGASVVVDGGNAPQDATSVASLPPAELSLLGAPDAAEENDLRPQSSKVRGGEVPGCLLRGAHYFVLPYYGPDGPQGSKMEGICKECGLEKWWPSRPRRHRRATKSVESILAADPSTGTHSLDLRPITEEAPADWDRLMEAVCFARRGSWASFDAMASRVEDSPWFPIEAARLLSSLGHLSLSLHPRSLRPLRWSLAPATIAIISEAEAILAGYRSNSLLERLADDVGALDGRLLTESQARGPNIIRLLDLDREALVEVAASTAAALGRDLLVCEEPALAIATLLPPMDALLDSLPTLERAPDRAIECFDFSTAKWARVDEIDVAGAYRFQDRPLRYCVSNGAGTSLRVADNRLAKWLAAEELGLSLLAYEEASGTLTCPLGSQLPGLYERAAVLASGRAPTPRTDGAVVYSDVPAAVASRLWQALGSKLEVR